MPAAKPSKSRKTGASRTKSKNAGPLRPKGFVAGFVCGLLSAFMLVWIWHFQTSSPEQEPLPIASADENNTTDEFEFFTLLNDMEVPVTEPVETKTTRSIYWLQAASFRNPADAEEMRISLILQNIDSEVTQVQQGESSWHRVMTGPFQSRTEMAKVRGILLESGTRPMLVVEEVPIEPTDQ